MAKRRTKKQKKNAKHNIKITWGPKDDTGSKRHSVKDQKKLRTKSKLKDASNKQNSSFKAKPTVLASVKKDIVKSLSLAGLIIGLEVMIYLFL